MISFQKADGTRTVFVVKRVILGQTANGGKYTKFSISQKDKNSNTYEYLNVFCWDALPIKDGDKVEITNVRSVTLGHYVKDGERKYTQTISADVKVVVCNTEQPIDVEGDLVPDFTEKPMPF